MALRRKRASKPSFTHRGKRDAPSPLRTAVGIFVAWFTLSVELGRTEHVEALIYEPGNSSSLYESYNEFCSKMRDLDYILFCDDKVRNHVFDSAFLSLSEFSELIVQSLTPAEEFNVVLSFVSRKGSQELEKIYGIGVTYGIDSFKYCS